MKNSEQQLISSWLKAAADLNINIIPNFKLLTDDGNNIEFLILIEDFGSPKGTLIVSLETLAEFDTPEKYGYYCSALNTQSYGKYNRENFIDTLEDWRYLGPPNLKPIWYKGIYES